MRRSQNITSVFPRFQTPTVILSFVKGCEEPEEWAGLIGFKGSLVCSLRLRIIIPLLEPDSTPDHRKQMRSSRLYVPTLVGWCHRGENCQLRIRLKAFMKPDLTSIRGTHEGGELTSVTRRNRLDLVST
jgi:hypothetical protein